MTDKIVILAGGISSRMKEKPKKIEDGLTNLYSQADSKAKTMITLDGQRPFLDYLLFNIMGAGLKHVLIIIGEKDKSIPEHYRQKETDNIFEKLLISYAIQKIPSHREKPWGTADALYQGLANMPHWKGEEFLVVNSDNLYSSQSMKLLIDCDSKNALLDYDRTGFKFEASRVSRFAITKKNEKGFLTDIIEKPNQQQINAAADKNGFVRVSMNCWKFYYDQIFPYLEACPENPVRKEKEIPSAVLNMVKEHPDSVLALPVKEHVPDLTSKDDLSSVIEDLKNNKTAFL
jgi:glucose-1-phosphate adenylyltransferase